MPAGEDRTACTIAVLNGVRRAVWSQGAAGSLPTNCRGAGLAASSSSDEDRRERSFFTMLRTAASRSLRPLVGNARGIATAKLPDLPYDFGALQPVISGEIMQVRGPVEAYRPSWLSDKLRVLTTCIPSMPPRP